MLTIFDLRRLRLILSSSTLTRVYKIPLGYPSIFSDNSIQLVCANVSTSAEVVRTIDATRRLVAFSHSCSVSFLNWNEFPGKKSVTISAETEGVEEMVR